MHFLWYFLQNPCHTHSNKRFLGQEIALAGEQRQRHRYAFAAEKPHGGVNQRIWSAVQPLSAPCEVGGITTKPYSKIQKERWVIFPSAIKMYHLMPKLHPAPPFFKNKHQGGGAYPSHSQVQLAMLLMPIVVIKSAKETESPTRGWSDHPSAISMADNKEMCRGGKQSIHPT